MDKSITPIDERICQNCRHYFPYYIRRLSTLRKTGDGDCRHPKNNRIKANPTPCERWEDISIRQEEENEAMKNAIASITNQLTAVTLLLNIKDQIL